MKNKIEIKSLLIKSLIISLIFIIIIIILNIHFYKVYTKNYNLKLNNIMNYILEKYPNTSEIDLIKIINSKAKNTDFIREYGIDINKDSLILENNYYFKNALFLNLLLITIYIIIIITTFIKYNSKKNQELNKITNYIEQINNKNYKLDIDSNSESELSILKNEIYKTTVILKEQAENALEAKINIKNSLSDISHQIKTPLTVILILIDNLIDNNNINKNEQEEALRKIKREIMNINFLISSLLKLSKFEANTITFNNDEVQVLDIINKAILNVSVIADLKNIKINLIGDEDTKINCDFFWQTEALTNILKNSLEHSLESSLIDIICEKSAMYVKIIITDYGVGIKKEDISHIFERFYSSNTSLNNTGIGLSLAKTIIEHNNGTITVTSNELETKFIIKYYN